MSSDIWQRHNDRVIHEIKRFSLMSDWVMRCVPRESRPPVLVGSGDVMWSTHVDREERERAGRSANCGAAARDVGMLSLNLMDDGTGAEFSYAIPAIKGGLAWAVVDAWVERGALLRRAEEHKTDESVLVSVVKWED